MMVSSDSLRDNIENQILAIEQKLEESHKKQRELEEKTAVSAIKRNPKYFFLYA